MKRGPEYSEIGNEGGFWKSCGEARSLARTIPTEKNLEQVLAATIHCSQCPECVAMALAEAQEEGSAMQQKTNLLALAEAQVEVERLLHPELEPKGSTFFDGKKAGYLWEDAQRRNEIVFFEWKLSEVLSLDQKPGPISGEKIVKLSGEGRGQVTLFEQSSRIHAARIELNIQTGLSKLTVTPLRDVKRDNPALHHALRSLASENSPLLGEAFADLHRPSSTPKAN